MLLPYTARKKPLLLLILQNLFWKSMFRLFHLLYRLDVHEKEMRTDTNGKHTVCRKRTAQTILYNVHRYRVWCVLYLYSEIRYTRNCDWDWNESTRASDFIILVRFLLCFCWLFFPPTSSFSNIEHIRKPFTPVLKIWTCSSTKDSTDTNWFFHSKAFRLRSKGVGTPSRLYLLFSLCVVNCDRKQLGFDF